MASRPKNFVSTEEVLQVIENSINSAYSWMEKTNDAFNSEERIGQLETLYELIVILKWRYGSNHVRFQFTRKKVENVIDITDIFPEEAADWKNRVVIDERTDGPTTVYIRF